MNNRDYAALLLEEGTFTEEEQMTAAMQMMKPKIRKMIDMIISPEYITPVTESGEELIQAYAQIALKEVSKTLSEKYEAVVGLWNDPVTMDYSIGVGLREKHDWENRIKFTERYGLGVLDAGASIGSPHLVSIDVGHGR